MRWIARVFLVLLVVSLLMAVVWTINGGIFGLVLGAIVVTVFWIPYRFFDGRASGAQRGAVPGEKRSPSPNHPVPE